MKTGISILLLGAAAVISAGAGKKKPAVEPYTLLAGTVFRDTGFSLPNAEVIVIPSPAGGTQVKIKKLQAVSDSRGEFAFRLPTGKMQYVIKVSAKGYHSEEKSIAVDNEDRVDVTFQLHEESK